MPSIDPHIEESRKRLCESTRRLEPAYRRYVAAVSTPDMAVSLETAAFAYGYCISKRPARILNLGSGFSSYALRCAAAEFVGDVVCADDDPQWLARTQDFLQSEATPYDAMTLWPAEGFLDPPFEFVFHDLGNMILRAETLAAVMMAVASEGSLLLDDLHKEPYRRHCEETLAERRWRSSDLREFTVDSYGRFAWLAYPPP